ncbi:MAG: alanine--glyoxylate aminotransferase family protein, partial [Candidatus Firestonebacteria bacterium]|nr:alanine--glyoxylate aminotransferase family protein [Candidatus Firestonebacteria bacterium]
MKKNYLLTPGPTAVPSEISLEMAKPMIHHRTPVYIEVFKKVNESLKNIFRTKNNVYVLTSSGTGAMETAVVNLLSAGDTVLVINSGKFGERWGKICEAYGVNVIAINVEWGKSATPESIQKSLHENKQIKAVFTTLCETSTGVRTDVEAIGKVVKETEAILVVDTISGLGAEDFYMDDWNIDAAVAGSQKALMLPPGLAFIALSEKAAKLTEKSKLPKFYWSLKKAKKSLEDGETPFTPAISLVIGLNKALQMIQEEGLENVIIRHAKLAKATREAAKAMGLELFAPLTPSNAVTPVKVPAGVDASVFIKKLKSKYGVTIIGGQDHLKGKIFRIAHLGYMDQFDIIIAISAMEMVLVEMGYKLELGKGVASA